MLTADDKKNGWDEKSLAKYQKERDKANSESISNPKVKKPTMQESYNPLRWRD